jgi:hypothetical protein
MNDTVSSQENEKPTESMKREPNAGHSFHLEHDTDKEGRRQAKSFSLDRTTPSLKFAHEDRGHHQETSAV